MAETTETPAGISTPIQPTGFGVADLEIAREQAALADDDAATDTVDEHSTAALSPTDVSGAAGAAAAESEGHPS